MRDLRSGYNPDSHPILLFIKQIEDDLYRTFPQHPCFQPRLNDEYRQMFAGLNLSSREGRRPSIHDIDIPISPCLGQSYFSSREENVYLLSLRRILVAFAYYSWPQPENSTYTVESQCSYKIGYCQGLNCVVGLILLAFTSQNGEIKRQFESADTQTINSIEADVFWTFVGLVENILPPEMYGFNLQGARLQQYIMWEVLIKAKGDKCGLEKLQKWFKTLNTGKRMSGNGSLAAITMPWFLSLFVNILPMETVFCLLDNLVYHGEKILFRAALAVLFLNEEQICNCYDAGDAGFYLKTAVNHKVSSKEFIELCFEPRISKFEALLSPKLGRSFSYRTYDEQITQILKDTQNSKRRSSKASAVLGSPTSPLTVTSPMSLLSFEGSANSTVSNVSVLVFKKDHKQFQSKVVYVTGKRIRQYRASSNTVENSDSD